MGKVGKEWGRELKRSQDPLAAKGGQGGQREGREVRKRGRNGEGKEREGKEKGRGKGKREGVGKVPLQHENSGYATARPRTPIN